MLESINSGENFKNDLIDNNLVYSKPVIGKYWYFCKKCHKYLGSEKPVCKCLDERELAEEEIKNNDEIDTAKLFNDL